MNNKYLHVTYIDVRTRKIYNNVFVILQSKRDKILRSVSDLVREGEIVRLQR